MALTMTQPVISPLDKYFSIVLVPGLRNSDDYHWQSFWARRFAGWRRISQRNWVQPDIENWVSAIRRELAVCPHPVILIGHSFGALASRLVVQNNPENIAGIVMVAPAEPSYFQLEEKITTTKSKTPGIVFGSHNDPLMPFGRAIYWASHWQYDIIDLGDAGHINSESGYGEWEYGLERIFEFGNFLLDR